MNSFPARKMRSMQALVATICLLAQSISQASSLDLGTTNTDCDVSATALNDKIPGIEIPRTCIEFNGRVRCYYTYVPECADGATPLVYDMHPYMVCPSQYADYSGWMELATSKCFVVVWPIGITDLNDSTALCWAVPAGNTDIDPLDPSKETQSCCCVNGAAEDPFNPVDPDEVGDLEFVRETGPLILDEVARQTSSRVEIDTRRIYMTGHSNGCYASFGMAMRHSDFVAATACMAGLWVTPPALDYSPTPMWSVIGGQDLVVPPSGRDMSLGYVPSYATAFDNLMSLNGCKGIQEENELVPSMDTFFSKGNLETLTATGCQNNATVEFLKLSTAGHTPFKGVPEFLPIPPIAASTTVDTTGLAWNFLSSFEKDQVPPEFVNNVVEASSPEITLQPTQEPTSAPSMKPSTVEPSESPSKATTLEPSIEPSIGPTASPTQGPTGVPSIQPTQVPTTKPTTLPTRRPTVAPSGTPSMVPSGSPSVKPSLRPSQQPSAIPTKDPSQQPTSGPTSRPTGGPSGFPSSQPTFSPTEKPSSFPTNSPSSTPSLRPSQLPTKEPTWQPSRNPTKFPTVSPSGSPSARPSEGPTSTPSVLPTQSDNTENTLKPVGSVGADSSIEESSSPTESPSRVPTGKPTGAPTERPSELPSESPSIEPTMSPTESPTNGPSQKPTRAPSAALSPTPTTPPSYEPTRPPTATPSLYPTAKPSALPTGSPTDKPTKSPTERPTAKPTGKPTDSPTGVPTISPTGKPSSAPSESPTTRPSVSPTPFPTQKPTVGRSPRPTVETFFATEKTTVSPSPRPSSKPSPAPSSDPSSTPTARPSMQPTGRPTSKPSTAPSEAPTQKPSFAPTDSPSVVPTSAPSPSPSKLPTNAPSSGSPTAGPTENPTSSPSVGIPVEDDPPVGNLTAFNESQLVALISDFFNGSVVNATTDDSEEVAGAFSVADVPIGGIPFTVDQGPVRPWVQESRPGSGLTPVSSDSDSVEGSEAPSFHRYRIQSGIATLVVAVMMSL